MAFSAAENQLRTHLANPHTKPCLGRSVRTDEQIVAYLESLEKFGRGTRSAWETSLMNRLKAKIKSKKK
jgi:hypothetical protein